jgi:hypothetical protein
MKHINEYILEKLRIPKPNTKNTKQTIVATDFKDLNRIIADEINKNGVHCSLNHIDISNIENMSYCFHNYNIRKFDGDISEWDVSRVRYMGAMFLESHFTGKYGDISEWDVSNVTDMHSMFDRSNYSGDISGWDVSNVINMDWMFARCKTFNNDISNWDINKNCTMHSTFLSCSLDEKYRPTKI